MKRSFVLVFIMAGAIGFGLACGGANESDSGDAGESRERLAASSRSDLMVVNQRLEVMAQQLEDLQVEIESLRFETTERLNAAQQRTQTLGQSIQALGSDLKHLGIEASEPDVRKDAPASTPAPAADEPADVAPAPDAPETDGVGPNPFLRLLLLIVLLTAIWFIVRVFMGRWNEEDEDWEEPPLPTSPTQAPDTAPAPEPYKPLFTQPEQPPADQAMPEPPHEAGEGDGARPSDTPNGGSPDEEPPRT